MFCLIGSGEFLVDYTLCDPADDSSSCLRAGSQILDIPILFSSLLPPVHTPAEPSSPHSSKVDRPDSPSPQDDHGSATPTKSAFQIVHGIPTPPDSAFGASRVGSMTHLPEAQDPPSTPITSPVALPPTLRSIEGDEGRTMSSIQGEVGEVRFDEKDSWERIIYPAVEGEYLRLR